MLVRDIMTREVMTVTPETPVPALAALFAERGISGVPVVDASGNLIGLVTEGDLIRRLVVEGEQPRSWLSRLFGSSPQQAHQYAQIHGQRARDVMSTQLQVVGEEDTVSHAAVLLEKHHIRRLPVVKDGKLVGILSRADMMRALLVPVAKVDAPVSDRELLRRVQAEMRTQSWADSYLIFADVAEGVVTFHGLSRSSDVEHALRALGESIPGVKDVKLDLAPKPPFVLD
jgi:CBS domain-containing protein